MSKRKNRKRVNRESVSFRDSMNPDIAYQLWSSATLKARLAAMMIAFFIVSLLISIVIRIINGIF